MRIDRLAVIGVGLIGGSLARALRRANACGHVIGYAEREAELKRAVELGVIDDYGVDAASTVGGADMVIIAVPLSAVKGVFERIAGRLKEDAVITDVGSVKASVVTDARATLGDHLPWLVPGHPVAGTEKSGVEASFPELFEDRRVILTPIPETRADAVERVKLMWESTGATISTMAVTRHDEVLAATSHLPHVLAYSLVNTLANGPQSADVLRFAAGGFADFTRIASSSPRMWHDIVLANRDAILAMVEGFEQDLGLLMDAVKNNDTGKIMALFSSAKTVKDRFRSYQTASSVTRTGNTKDEHPADNACR